MLKFIMLIVGVAVMAPVAIAAFALALPVLPFAAAGFVVWKLMQSRRVKPLTAVESARDLPALSWPRYRGEHSNAFAPLVIGTLVVISIVQLKLVGFAWQFELGLGLAVAVVAGLWWVQSRIDARRRGSRPRQGEVAPHDLYRLFEIERAAGPEERRVLIARELNRLTREALRPDPATLNGWPSISALRSLRDQALLLRSSARDTTPLDPTDGNVGGYPSDALLMSRIQTLEDYVRLLLRVRLLGQADLEQMRILVRDQSRLRAMQDEVVGELHGDMSVSVAG